jgi:putative toxin-antitoxin system antitoxin component (TIGR02293 family)
MSPWEIMGMGVFGLLVVGGVVLAARQGAKQREQVVRYSATREYPLIEDGDARLAELLQEAGPDVTWRPQRVMLVKRPPPRAYLFGYEVAPKDRPSPAPPLRRSPPLTCPQLCGIFYADQRGGGMTTDSITRYLGGARVLGRGIDSDLDLDEAIAKGLPAASLQALLEKAALSAADLAPVIPERTQLASRGRERLTPEQSDRLARLARLLSLADETLGSAEKAWLWMERPNRALGGKRPIDLVKRSSGSLLVEQVLGRLAHGVYT